eukprot:scaffold5048_cov121-Cylindrotheca_fusiformis.AAC.15
MIPAKFLSKTILLRRELTVESSLLDLADGAKAEPDATRMDATASENFIVWCMGGVFNERKRQGEGGSWHKECVVAIKLPPVAATTSRFGKPTTND